MLTRFNKAFVCHLVVLLILVAASFSVRATTVTATQNGNWNQTSTWDPNTVPGCFDTIVIPPTITVTITVTVNLTSCPPVYILVQGTLNFQSGKKLNLPNGSVVYIAPGGAMNGGGGGGSSNTISIGGSDYWSAGCTGNPPPNCGNMTGPAIICQNCSLPIELVNFTAELQNRKVYLYWQTASETDNDYFVVQRSVDGLIWETTDSLDGALNSSALLSYASEDPSPYLGVSYYRLKQVDVNGLFSHSETRVITNGSFYSDQNLLVITNQNDYQQNIVIYFSEPISGEAEIYIYALNGSVIAHQKFNLTDEQWVVVEVNQRLSAGIYAIKANRLIEKTYLR